MDKKLWAQNAPNQMILNSIFAALAGGGLIAFIFSDSAKINGFRLIVLFLLIFSFLFFALSAEQTVNALDEKDVRKYAYYLLWYNCGVILLGASISFEIYAHFSLILMTFTPRFPLWLLMVIFFGIFMGHWIYDFFWLLFSGKKCMQDYLDELELDGSSKPESDPSCLMRKFYEWKNIKL